MRGKDRQDEEEKKKKVVFLLSTHCWPGVVGDALQTPGHFIFSTAMRETFPLPFKDQKNLIR